MNVDKYVSEMRNLLIMSKRMSEFHEKNLKNFPLVAMNNVSKVEIEYNIPDGTMLEKETMFGYVKFNVYTKSKRSAGDKKRSVKKRAEDIVNWTKSLLWNNMDVSVIVNNKKVFPETAKSSRKSKDEQ